MARNGDEREEVAEYGVPNVPKAFKNATFVYSPLIYKCDSDLAKYPSDVWIRFINDLYIGARYIN